MSSLFVVFKSRDGERERRLGRELDVYGHSVFNVRQGNAGKHYFFKDHIFEQDMKWKTQQRVAHEDALVQFKIFLRRREETEETSWAA